MLDAGSSGYSAIQVLAASTTTTTPPTTAPPTTPPASDTPTPTPTPTQTQPNDLGVPQEVLAKFDALDCTDPASRQGGGVDEPDAYVAACDVDGVTKYLLAPADVLGTDVDNAAPALPQGGIGNWEISLNFTGEGAKKFAQATTTLNSLGPCQVGVLAPCNQFAIVLDGVVQSAPAVNNGAITGGQASITGSFTQSEASQLANVLKYGALPLTFDTSDVTTVTPTLGADYLRAGLIAGALGLFLVVVYCLIYYRRLGVVVIASLAVAAVLTFESVVLLGEWIGFTLTLAGIAGLIVAVGITADSFIVYFERIRDEVREGKSPRVAVENGWLRARRTIISADFVSILAAVVLYIVSIGNVRGFAFALGLSTVIDLIVVFLFTKPLVSLFASGKLIGGGSALDAEHLGVRVAATAEPRRPRRSRTATTTGEI
jgi:preprotein translocase subunit SecD